MLLDCHADMFRTDDEDKPSPMDLSLQVAKKLLQDTVRTTVAQRTGKRNGIGIVLFNTKREISSKTTADDNDDMDQDDEYDDDDGKHFSQGVHIFMTLVPPGISHVLDLNKCLEKERNLQLEFQQEKKQEHATSATMAPLQTALEVCQDMFKKAKCVKDAPTNSDPLVDSKSIWIFTSNDNPYPAGALQQLKTIAEEAKEQNVKIVVWPLATSSNGNGKMEVGGGEDEEDSNNGPSFDYSLFYEELASDVLFDDPMSTMEDLKDALEELCEDYKKPRRAYHGPMRLPDWRQRILSKEDLDDEDKEENNTAIMVDWFKFVQFAKKPSTVQIDLQSRL